MINWKNLWNDAKLEIWYIWARVRDFFRNLLYFFKNIYTFRKDMWNFREWDHECCKDIYCTALEALKECIYRNGNEIDVSRLKKVDAMEELLYLLQRDIFDEYWEAYMNPLHTMKMDDFNKMCRDAEKARLKRICELLTGQDDSKFIKEYEIDSKKIDKMLKDHPLLKYNEDELYNEACYKHFDGSGCTGWWD